MEDHKSPDEPYLVKTMDSSFPYDLQPLFSLNHLNQSFETLKDAIQFLANQQKDQNERLASLESTDDGHLDFQSVNKSAMSSMRGNATPQPIRELKEQVKKNKDDIYELRMQNKTVLEKLDSVNSKVSMLDKNVDILKSMSGPTDGGPDLSSIMDQLEAITKKTNDDLSQMIGDNYQRQQEQIEDLQSQLRDQKETDVHLQNEIDAIKRLLSGIGAKVNTLSQNYTSALSESQEKLSLAYQQQEQMVEKEPAVDHTEDFKKIWVEIKRLRDTKCDMDVFEARLLKIDEYLADDQGQIDNLKATSNRGRSGKRRNEADLDIDGWNKTMELAYETDKKVDSILNEVGVGGFASMKQSIQRIQQKLNESVDKAEITKTINEMKSFAGKLDQMIYEVDENGRQIQEIRKSMGKLGKAPTIEDFQLLRTRVDNCENMDDKLRKMINELDKKLKLLKNANNGNPNSEENMLERCIGDLKDLRSNFEEHRDDSKKNIKSINEQILNKLDKQDMAKIEKQFEEMFQKNNISMSQQFASKEDTSRKFNVMSKKVRELVEQVQKMGQEESDGMFTKKNFGPVNCASCEKNLTNMAGMPVDHTNWKKLPFREGANDRIARYAAGFSKMLSTLQPEETPVGQNKSSINMTPNVSYLDRMQNSSSPFNKQQIGQHFQSVSWDETNAQLIPAKNYPDSTPGGMPFQTIGSPHGPMTGLGHVTHTTLPSSHINQGYPPVEGTGGPSHKTSASFFKPTLLNSNSGQGQNIYLPHQQSLQQQPVQVTNQYNDKRHSSNTRNLNNGSGALFHNKNSPLQNVQPIARGSRSPDIGVGQHLLNQAQDQAFQNSIQNQNDTSFQQHNDVLPQLTARNQGKQ